jgi:uncharacterized protein (TIGR02246 family)
MTSQTSQIAPASGSDEQKIRALIDLWAASTSAGDLIALMNLMTEDAVFLTAGQPPMRRKEFAESFVGVTSSFTLAIRSRVQEITIDGSLAVCWNLLEVDITPAEGGSTTKRAGNTLTALRRGSDGQWRIFRDANLLTLV